MRRLENKVALVTGGGSGFGEGIVERFAREGAKVGVVDIDLASAEKVARAVGQSAIPVRADVSKAGDVANAVKAAADAFGRVDILVNNAGISHRNQPMLDVSEDEFDRLYAVNVKAIYLFARAVVPLMR